MYVEADFDVVDMVGSIAIERGLRLEDAVPAVEVTASDECSVGGSLQTQVIFAIRDGWRCFLRGRRPR